MFSHIQEVLTAQVVISHFHPSVHRTGIDGDIDKRLAYVSRRIGYIAANLGEGSADRRDSEMTNRKLRRRVWAIQVPSVRIGRSCCPCEPEEKTKTDNRDR